MEYKKIINLSGNTSCQPSKFRTKTWTEINDDARGTYSTYSQIKFKTSMLKSNICNDSDVHILVSITITVENPGTAAASTKRKRYNN